MAGNLVAAARPVKDATGQRTTPLAMALRYTLAALVAAGLTELVLLRTLSRVGIHIPKQGLVLDAYNLLTAVGSFAFNLATVLTILALGLALHRWAQRRASALIVVPTAAVIATLLGLAVARPFLATDATASLTFGLLTISALLLLAVPHCLSSQRPRAPRLAVALILVAYLCSQYYSLSYASYQLSGLAATPPLAMTALSIGEAIIPGAAVVAFWAWGWGTRPSALRLAIPAAAALVLLASYAGNSPTSAILALWMEGLTLYLPLPLYAGAFGLYLLTALNSLARRDGFYIGCALLILLVAGYTLETTYQHLLAVLAILLLTGGDWLTIAEPEAAGEAEIALTR